jgi:DNA-binding beta-propeller fold protein YncE
MTCRFEGAPPDAKPELPAGALFSIDVATAETNPANAVKGKVPGECAPVRLSLAPDGHAAWVSNRGSNSVTLFDVAKIDRGDASAKTASIAVGSNPVAITATNDGRYVLVGLTNRFGSGGTKNGSLAVIDAHTNSVVGTIPSGLFPREFSHGAGTTIFLSNNRSDSVTVYDERRIAELIQPKS